MEQIKKAVHCGVCKISPTLLHFNRGECEYIILCKKNLIREVTVLDEDEYSIKEIPFNSHDGRKVLMEMQNVERN